MSETSRLPVVPASFFGMVLGIIGLGSTWRLAHQVWGLPAWIGELIMAVGALVWAGLIVLYLLKCLRLPAARAKEWEDPVQCCFVGLAGVGTMLVAGAALPYSRPAAWWLFTAGSAFTVWFMIWRTGILWRGERNPASSTPVLYLPAVAGSFVSATIVSALGYPEVGQFAFGAGLFTWFAIESVLLLRFYTAATMPPALRPTLGIMLAPPAVGCVAYLSVDPTGGGIIARCLLGYGLMQAALLLRMLPWIREQSFAASYWAFSFGATALASAPLIMIKRGDGGVVQTLAPYLFVGVNLVLALIALGTIGLLFMGRLLPKPTPAPA